MDRLIRVFKILQHAPETRQPLYLSLSLLGIALVLYLVSAYTSFTLTLQACALLCTLLSFQSFAPLLPSALPRSETHTFGTQRSSSVCILATCVACFAAVLILMLDFQHASANQLDYVAALLLCVYIAYRCQPLFADAAAVLLNATPPEIYVVHEKCQAAVLALDGVLEIRDVRGFALSAGAFVMTVVVRISAGANAQRVLAEVHKIYAPFAAELTVQCEKDVLQ
jgi:Co/Zn/Cd efflux system component